MEMINNNFVGDGAAVDKDDIISSLLNDTTFKVRPDDVKLSILRKGRPLPKLCIVKRDSTRNCNRTFQESWYSIHRWLCGSKQYNKLFCWPCLLMRPETSSWCSTGNDDMKRLSSMASKHSICKSHRKAVSEYDCVLISFGLQPEFEEELEDKKGQEVVDGADGQVYLDVYFADEVKARNNELGDANRLKSKKDTDSNIMNFSGKYPDVKNQMSFKSWQELNRYAHPFARSTPQEDQKLFKWKKKIARQELMNARLIGQKIKIEIELLRAKVNYLKSVEAAEKTCRQEPPVKMPLIVSVETDSPAVENAIN